jgi:hypothetical protein
MFKQTTPTKEKSMSNVISDRTEAITMQQLSAFAQLTGRSDVDFKIGKVSDAGMIK